MDSEFREKRAFPRFTITIPAEYLDPNSHERVCAQTNNISVEGLNLLTAKELIRDIDLDMSLLMVDDNERICIKGKVVWSNMIDPGRYMVGVKIEAPKLKPTLLVLRVIKAQRKY